MDKKEFGKTTSNQPTTSFNLRKYAHVNDAFFDLQQQTMLHPLSSLLYS